MRNLDIDTRSIVLFMLTINSVDEVEKGSALSVGKFLSQQPLALGYN